MSGTREGGQAAAATNKLKYGDDFYAIIGARGGSTKTTEPKGFAAMTKQQRSAAGKKGGSANKKYST